MAYQSILTNGTGTWQRFSCTPMVSGTAMGLALGITFLIAEGAVHRPHVRYNLSHPPAPAAHYVEEYAFDTFTAPTAWVSEAAYVVGNVVIGEYSSVWPGVTIRGDGDVITIGNHVNIQEGSVVHGDGLVIEDDVSIGHCVVVHGDRIGQGSLLATTVRSSPSPPSDASA